MWYQQHETWRLHDPEFEAERLDPARAAGPWHGHRWFAYDLLRWRAPQTLVELGTHYGPSFFAFCQAVKDGALPTRLHAIDSWAGDPHAGLYGPEVKTVFDGIREKAYGDLAIEEHIGLFRDALDDFENESIDLLHIDGYHSYEAARDDFESWLPKIALSGIVLMHDVAESTGYGSADYWRELESAYPSIAFPHSFGLGLVLPKGTEGFDYLLSAEFGRWRSYYTERSYHYLYGLQVDGQAHMIDSRDQTIRDQARLVDDQDAALKAQAAMIDERDDVIRDQTSLLDRRNADVHDRDALLAERTREVETLHIELSSKRRQGVATAKAVARKVRNLASRAQRRVVANGDIRLIFDAEYYLSANPDVAQSGLAPLQHYLRHGRTEGRSPSPFFDADFYLARNPDVAAAGMDPLTHFLEYGMSEGRDPSPIFSAKYYLRTYADVLSSGTNPLVHYLTTGIAEGRFVSPEHRRRVLERDRHDKRSTHAGQRTIVAATYDRPGATSDVLPLSALERLDADLVSLDLWDTVICRSRPADAAKLSTARRQYLRHHSSLISSVRSPWDLLALRVGVEADLAGARHHEEYEFTEVLRHVLREAVPTLDDGSVDRLALGDADHEWAEEIATTYPLRELWSLLQRLTARRPELRLAVISDFYVGEDRLRRLLIHHGWPFEVPVYVSCERQASKRLNGSMFRLVRQDFGVDPDRHIHIGDNIHADRNMQLSTGGAAVLIGLSPTRLPAPGQLSNSTVGAVWSTLHGEIAQLADFTAEFGAVDPVARRALAGGVANAPLAVGLVARAVELAQERSLDRVHYISREGAFLAQVHEAIAPILARGVGEPPRAVHLALSRRSTFGPSLADLGAASLGRMWSMYGVQSPRALLVSLGADPRSYEAALARHGLDPEQLLSGVANDLRVRAFLDDLAVATSLEGLLADRRELLLDYLRQATDLSPAAMVVVDVGWRGTIQDNVAHLLPSTQILGVYLGLFPYLNAQPANVSKEAVGFDGNAGDDFAFAEPPAAVERPWTPHVPSTIDYRRQPDGQVTPVVDREVQASRLIDQFQRGILAAAPRVAEFFITNGLTVSMIRSELKEDVRRYYEQPEGGVADIWFGSDHDDTFGALNVTPFGKGTPDARWLSSEGDKLWAESARASRWEPGYDEWLPVLAARELRYMLEELR